MQAERNSGSSGKLISSAVSISSCTQRVMLCGEQVRYFDLIRWGIAKQTINAEKQAQGGIQPFQDKNVLLPIPQSEKDGISEMIK